MQIQSFHPDDALERLMAGNERYAACALDHPHQTTGRRMEVTGGQHPFAIILTCSDSRVPPEILFDQGIGDLFVIRTAGNVADDIVLGSIEYAVEHLDVGLLVVLGHQSCGAVTAAVKDTHADGHIARIVDLIRPSVIKAKSLPGDLTSNAITANILQTASLLSECEPVLKEFVHNGRLKVIAAYYCLESGRVQILA